MTNDEEKLDPITAGLQDFIEAHRREIQQDMNVVNADLLTPISVLPEKSIGSSTAYAAISQSIERAEILLRKAYSSHSMDFWLTHLRRLPTILRDWPDDWINYATVGAFKWSNYEQDTSLGAWRVGDTFAVAYEASDEDLFLCCRIASICAMIAGLNRISRWVGKGSSVRHAGNGRLTLDPTPEVEKAIDQYEKRRPDHQLFADEGLLFFRQPIVSANHLFLLIGRAAAPFNQAILEPSGDKYPLNYLLHWRASKDFLQVFVPYDEALQDLFGLGAEKICNVFEALGRLVIHTIPPSDEMDGLVFKTDLSDAIFSHKFRFMIDLLQKGFVRFPETHLRSELVASMMVSGIEPQTAQETVDLFFNAFCLQKNQRSRIDLRTLEPAYMLYASPGERCYIDLVQLSDFLRWLIICSKEWFSSQHGDRFTLGLKTMIENEVGNAQVISWKKKYAANSLKSEVDLLVFNDGVLYAIECKAFAKSRSYWLGDPGATVSRTGKIDKAVKQAKDAATAVQGYVEANPGVLPHASSVEWVVCCPAQEYIRPWDKYGFLSENIPKVCTPQELIHHFSTAK